MQPMVLPLESLHCGEWAEVEDIVGEQSLVSRLAELGRRVGGRLKMVRQGLPCLLQVGGARLSLRGLQDLQVLVRPLSA